MVNMVAKVCKVFAIVLFVLAFIGAIFLSIVSESISILIAGWISSFLTCAGLYAIGEIVEHVAITSKMTSETYDLLYEIYLIQYNKEKNEE